MKINHNKTATQKRTKRVRGKLHGTAERPRLTVHRSNKYIYLQIINDAEGKTIAAANSAKEKEAGTKMEETKAAALRLAEQLKKTKVKKLMFDRGPYQYHGRVQAVADVMREQGFEV